MFKRFGIIAIAFGLMLFSSLGQTQEQTQDEQRQPATKQNPAQVLPIPLPIDIIEDETTAKARERREAETRQHEIDDLVAQQGMNIATQAMNKATQRMAVYAYYSTWFVGVGTALLILTLWLARQANRAAMNSVEITKNIGEAQTRAYVVVKECKYVIKNNIPNSEIIFGNCGQTPAYDVRLTIGNSFGKGKDTSVMIAESSVGDSQTSKATVGRDGIITRTTTMIEQISPSDIEGINIGTHYFTVYGIIRYSDVFGRRWESEFQLIAGGVYGVNKNGHMSISKHYKPEKNITSQIH